MKTYLIVHLVAAMCLATVVHAHATTAKSIGKVWVEFFYNEFHPFGLVNQNIV